MCLFTQPQSIVVKFTKSCFKILHIVIGVNCYIVPKYNSLTSDKNNC